MDAAMQVRLLRTLEERQIRRVGGEKAVDVDVRVVSATNAGLPDAIAEKRFREDLYYRLNTFTIELPPLRERSGDVEILANRFLASCAREMRKAVTSISSDAVSRLRDHQWPGNVRELKNTIERAVIVAAGHEVQGYDLQFVPRANWGVPVSPVSSLTASDVSVPTSPRLGDDLNLETLERAAIEEALRRSNGNRAKPRIFWGCPVLH